MATKLHQGMYYYLIVYLNHSKLLSSIFLFVAMNRINPPQGFKADIASNSKRSAIAIERPLTAYSHFSKQVKQIF